MTHDYKRHRTTTLFAALDVATGTIHQTCLPQHRHLDVLVFLTQMLRNVPKDLAIHVLLDNYATHKHANVKAWLTRPPPPLSLHPTSASWRNLLEWFFGELTQRQIRCLVVASVDQLIATITA